MKDKAVPAVTWTLQSEQPRQSLRERLGAMPPLLLLSVSFGLWLQTAFPSLAISFLWFAPLLFAVGALLLLCCGTRAEKWVYCAAALGAALVFVLCRHSFLLLVNDLCTALQRVSGHIYLHFETDGKVWPILVCAVGGGAVLLSRACLSGSMLWLLPMLIPMVEGALASVVPFRAGAALFIGGMLLLFRRQGMDLRRMIGRVAVSAVCLALALCIALPFRGMAANPVFPALREAAHGLVYDRRTNAMPEGKLSKLKGFNRNDTPALTLTLENGQPMYLRGAIYESYTGKDWKALPSDTRAGYAQLFYWLHDADYYGQTQVASAMREVGAAAPQRVTVQTRNACRAHGYLPYGASDIAADETLIGDAFVPVQQTFSCYADDAQTLRDAQRALVRNQAQHEDYLQLEQAFCEYAQKVDLSITDDARAALDRQFADWVPDSASMADIRAAIRAYLDETLTYDETAGAQPKHADFLQSLLEGSGRGYSVHYATAAVLMLRYCGIPARYVEGYFVGDNDGGTLTLTEENAHAWAEMYLDGIGFVPFEVTPGYFGDEVPQNEAENKLDRAGKAPAAAPFNDPPKSDEPDVQEATARPFPLYLLWILLPALLLAGLALWITLRRRRLRRALRAIDALSPREAVLRRYAYTLLLRGFVPERLPDSDAVAEAVRLSQFSDHEITEAQRRATDAFALAVRTDCLRQWNMPQRLYYRFIRCIVL